MDPNDKLACTKLNMYYQKNQSVISGKPEYDVRNSPIDNRPRFTAILSYAGETKEGIGPSKNEARRVAACHMLNFLYKKDSSKFSPEKKSVTEAFEMVEEFDSDTLSAHFDKYLEDRQRNTSVFNREFVRNVADNLADHFNNIDAGFKSVNSPKSDIINKIIEQKLDIEVTKAPRVFEKILKQMDLKYYTEFVESAKNDKYVVMIKINFNLFIVYGIGGSPEKAIQTACKNAIEFLTIFNS